MRSGILALDPLTVVRPLDRKSVLRWPRAFPMLPAVEPGCHTPVVKSLTEQLWFEVPNRRGFVNITETVEGLVRKSGVQEGLCLVNESGFWSKS